MENQKIIACCFSDTVVAEASFENLVTYLVCKICINITN